MKTELKEAVTRGWNERGKGRIMGIRAGRTTHSHVHRGRRHAGCRGGLELMAVNNEGSWSGASAQFIPPGLQETVWTKVA